MGKTLYHKIFDSHVITEASPGVYQLFVDLHLVHEATSPQAFSMLRERGLPVFSPKQTFATADHVVPTVNLQRPFSDVLAEQMMNELEKNTKEFSIPFFSPKNRENGKNLFVKS